MWVVQLGELHEYLDHLVGTLAAGHHQYDVGIGLTRNGVLQHRLTSTERTGYEARAPLGYGVEGVYSA